MSSVQDLLETKKSFMYKFIKHKIVSTLLFSNILWDVLVLMSTLEIVLANISRAALVLLELTDFHQWNKVVCPFCVPSW